MSALRDECISWSYENASLACPATGTCTVPSGPGQGGTRAGRTGAHSRTPVSQCHL